MIKRPNKRHKYKSWCAYRRWFDMKYGFHWFTIDGIAFPFLRKELIIEDEAHFVVIGPGQYKVEGAFKL